MAILGEGPKQARVLFVIDAPDYEARKQWRPVVTHLAKELVSQLHAVGYLKSEIRIITLTEQVPDKKDSRNFFKTEAVMRKEQLPFPVDICISDIFPDLEKEISRCDPEVIIPMGEVALWALTGEKSLTKYRGSELTLCPVWEADLPDIRVVPTFGPQWVSKVWESRVLVLQDLKKALGPAIPEPEWNFQIPVTYPEAISTLEELCHQLDLGLITRIAADIETKDRLFIDCIGFAQSAAKALVIPFFQASTYQPLYSAEEELALVLLVKKILRHPRCYLVGQNWNYDRQVIARLWGFDTPPHFDTMIAHAIAYPGTPKALGYLSSLYCQWHRYWKDDSNVADLTVDDQLRWEYNAKDCCTTWEIAGELMQVLRKANLYSQFQFKMRTADSLFRMMLRGVRQDNSLRPEMMMQIMPQQQALEQFFLRMQAECFSDIVLAKTKKAAPWYSSTTQQVKLFYHELKLPPQYDRRTRRPTVNDNALQKLAKKEPVFKPVMDALGAYRSLGVFLSTFILVRLDHDKRLRCSYGAVGTETFRLNSSKDAFGFGGNLQNIPTGNE